MLSDKLAIGTAQFGLNYGINNTRGKVPLEEVREILRFAYDSGINTLDTASLYGDSEDALGKSIADKDRYKIITKFKTAPLATLQNSLGRLHQGSVYGYLYHSFSSFEKNEGDYKELMLLKKQKKVRKVGFSLYYPSELEYLFEKDIAFDMVQVPASIFDQRFLTYLPMLKKKNIEVHARSVFLQGLVYKDPEELGGHFNRIKDKIGKLYRISRMNNIPVGAICLMSIIQNPYIDKVIIGIDNKDNLRENMGYDKYAGKVNELHDEILSLRETDEDLIIPANWGKDGMNG